MFTFDETAAALDVVEAVIDANARMLGEPPAIHAGTLPDGRIALFVNGRDVPSTVLGSPQHAVGFAQRAFRRCADRCAARDAERDEPGWDYAGN